MVRDDQVSTLGFVLEAPKPYVPSRLRAVLDAETLIATPDAVLATAATSAAKLVVATPPEKVWTRTSYLAENKDGRFTYVLYANGTDVAIFNRDFLKILARLGVGEEFHIESRLGPAYAVLKGQTVALLMPCKVDGVVDSLPNFVGPL